MIMQEIWKDIQGFEGLYQISTLGRVKSLFRKFIGGSRGVAYRKEMIMKPFRNSGGYYLVELTKLGIGKTISIHRLVGLHFIPNPDNKKTINHKNGNKADNRVSELEWATQKENVNHSYKTGLKVNSKGTSHYRSTPIIFVSKKGNASIIYSSATAAIRDNIIPTTSLYSVLRGDRPHPKYIIKYLNAS